MTVLWLVEALLVAAALLFLLPPLAKKGGRKTEVERKELNVLLFKDQVKELEDDLSAGEITQDQFDLAKHDLERSLLQDVAPDAEEAEKQPVLSSALASTLGSKSAIAVALIVPILAFSLYYKLGAGEAGLNPESASSMDASVKGHNGTLEQQVRKLQDHLQSKPDDLDGWVMLARSYYYLKQYQAATDAFARAVSLTKEGEPELLADYADAMAMANGRNMTGKPYELVKKALAIQPFHQKALWLAGTASYEEKDYKTSLGYWEKLLQQFPKNSPQYLQMLRNIGEVKQLMGENVNDVMAEIKTAEAAQSVTSAAPAATGGSTGAAGGKSVSGEVSLDPSLKSKVSPTDTLFIFARAANGPRMPLAILRMQASALPVKFKLDDSNAMNPAMSISKFPQVVVSARISKSGNAMPQDGDLSGATAAVNVGAEGLKITINQTVGQAGATASAGAGPATTVASSGAAVSGEVTIDPSLKSRVSPNDTVFIFARAANGPRMPLAILRTQASALPVKFKLDDSNAMNPAMSISKFPQVVVSARISKSGNAMPQSGDLSGATSVVNVGAQNLQITINKAVP